MPHMKVWRAYFRLHRKALRSMPPAPCPRRTPKIWRQVQIEVLKPRKMRAMIRWSESQNGAAHCLVAPNYRLPAPNNGLAGANNGLPGPNETSVRLSHRRLSPFVGISLSGTGIFRLKCVENNVCQRPLVAYFLHKKNGLTVSEFSRSKKAASPLSFFVNLLASRPFAPFC